jgi:hypothetical protein
MLKIIIARHGAQFAPLSVVLSGLGGSFLGAARKISMFGEMTRHPFGRQRIGEAVALHRIEDMAGCEEIESEIASVPRNDAGGSAADLDNVGVRHKAPFRPARVAGY